MNCMKRIIAVICCIFMLFTVLVGCGKDDTAKDSENSVSTDGASSDDGKEYDANGYLKDSIPDEIDYGGDHISIMGWGDDEAAVDFNVDTVNGDRISYQTYARNTTVESRLGVKLNFDLTLKGNNANRYDYIAAVERNLMGGEIYDLIACYSQCVANFTTDGYLVDLKAQSAFDFSAPWWSSYMIESSEINDKVFFASGSISTTSILRTMIIAVNMDLVDDYGLDDPREIAADGNWTLEELYKMCLNKGSDTNQNIQGKDNGDTFGFTMWDSTIGDAFLVSSGLRYLSTDNSGKLIIAPEFKGEKIYDLAQELLTKFKSNDFLYESSNNSKVFTGKRTMFFGSRFDYITDNKGDIDFNYGYLPFPKYDAEQENYFSNSGFIFSMWCIPQQCSDYERSAYVMEALASEGYRQVQPEVYESIKYRGSSDAINVEMFDLIIESKTYDMGAVFHNNFLWDDSPVALWRTRLYKDVNADWYSAIANKSPTIEGVLDTINSAFGY